MSENNDNDVKSRYNKDVQMRYKSKCMQIAIRYGINGKDSEESKAIEIYCQKHNIGRGNLAKQAIREKLIREKYL